MTKKKIIYGFLIILLMAFLGGSTGVFTKIALTEISPFSFTFLRFLFAALLIVPFVIKKLPKGNYLKLLLLSLFAAGNVIIFAFGIKHTTAISGSVMYVLTPIITVALGALLFRHKFSKLNIFGVILGFVGAITIILLPMFYGNSIDVGSLWGNILVLIAVLSFTIYTVWSKSMQKIFSPETITAGFLFVTLVLTGIMCLWNGTEFIGELSNMSTNVWLSVVFVGLFGTGLHYGLHQLVIKKNSSLSGALFVYLQPVATVLLAIPILGEKVTYLFVIGAVLALLGVWLSSKKSK